jgi:hypothetical protein
VAASFGALGSVLPDSVLSDSKKPVADFSGTGFLATIKICG